MELHVLKVSLLLFLRKKPLHILLTSNIYHVPNDY